MEAAKGGVQTSWLLLSRKEGSHSNYSQFPQPVMRDVSKAANRSSRIRTALPPLIEFLLNMFQDLQQSCFSTIVRSEARLADVKVIFFNIV